MNLDESYSCYAIDVLKKIIIILRDFKNVFCLFNVLKIGRDIINSDPRLIDK